MTVRTAQACQELIRLHAHSCASAEPSSLWVARWLSSAAPRCSCGCAVSWSHARCLDLASAGLRPCKPHASCGRLLTDCTVHSGRAAGRHDATLCPTVPAVHACPFSAPVLSNDCSEPLHMLWRPSLAVLRFDWTTREAITASAQPDPLPLRASLSQHPLMCPSHGGGVKHAVDAKRGGDERDDRATHASLAAQRWRSNRSPSRLAHRLRHGRTPCAPSPSRTTVPSSDGWLVAAVGTRCPVGWGSAEHARLAPLQQRPESATGGDSSRAELARSAGRARLAVAV